MPPEAFLMTGAAAPFRLAEPCEMSGGPHRANRDRRTAFLLADAATKDGESSVRLALWRCAECGVQLVGVGHTAAAIDAKPGTGVHVQEFTWLQAGNRSSAPCLEAVEKDADE